MKMFWKTDRISVKYIGLILMLLVAACTVAPPSRIPTPVPSTPTEIEDGNASPTVESTVTTTQAEVFQITDLRGVVVTYASWSSDSQILTFAVAPQGLEPHEWTWLQWDVMTKETEPLPAPTNPLSESVRRRLDIGRIEGSICDSSLVSLSPQQDFVVYTKMEPPQQEFSYELWIARLDGSDEQVLGHLLSRGCNRVRWSPAADQLVVATAGEAGEPQVFLAKTDGSSFERLEEDVLHTFMCQRFLPTFSPTGEMLLYSARDRSGTETCTLEVLSLDTKEIKPITESQGLAVWSDDGRAVYVLDPPHLLKVSVDTVLPTAHILMDNIPGRLSNTADEILVISPDATMVAFVGGDINGPAELRVVRSISPAE